MIGCERLQMPLPGFNYTFIMVSHFIKYSNRSPRFLDNVSIYYNVKWTSTEMWFIMQHAGAILEQVDTTTALKYDLERS